MTVTTKSLTAEVQIDVLAVLCCCVFQGGCITKLEQFLADHLLIIGAVGIGVACLQVILY